MLVLKAEKCEAVLLFLFQDTDGKIIAQCSGTKTATLEEGSRLYVGNKEVEVTPATLNTCNPSLHGAKFT